MADRAQTDHPEQDDASPGPGRLDPTVGPHSPAQDDVALTATDVTSAGVVAGRVGDERREHEAQASPPVGRGQHPDHPRDDPAAAQATDVREVD